MEGYVDDINYINPDVHVVWNKKYLFEASRPEKHTHTHTIRSLNAIVTQSKNYPYAVNTTTETQNITDTCVIVGSVAQSV